MNDPNLGFEPLRLPEGATEEDIVSGWEGSAARPVVSIICHTYNHAPYIADAIEGFLAQRTIFAFEIIIHDDASTDGTAEIVVRYARRFPTIIRTILQSENQFSQGYRPPQFSFPQVKGDYVALCEGDDYWLSADKLRKQVESLDRSGLRLSIHPAVNIAVDGEVLGYTGQLSESEVKIPRSAFITGGGNFCPTASMLVHRDGLADIPGWLPAKAPVMDYFFQILWSQGGAQYVPDIMSIYRMGGGASWSRHNYTDPKAMVRHFSLMIECLGLLRDTLCEEDDAITHALAQFRISGAKWALMGGANRQAWAFVLSNLRQKSGRTLENGMVAGALCCPPLSRYLLAKRRASFMRIYEG